MVRVLGVKEKMEDDDTEVNIVELGFMVERRERCYPKEGGRRGETNNTKGWVWICRLVPSLVYI